MRFSEAITHVVFPAFLVLLVCVGGATARAAEEWFHDWELEGPIDRSHLVLVARVASVSELQVIEGAKTNTTLREYRFQPVRRLKGIFSRDELAMTGADLGFPREDGSSPPSLKQGELRLLLLTRSAGRFGCSSVSGERPLRQRVPLLDAPDDAVASAAMTLVRVQASRSRKEQVEILLEHLREADGPEAVPLLMSLRDRAFVAAQHAGASEPLLRLARNQSASVRVAAAYAIESLLAEEYPQRGGTSLPESARVLGELLDSGIVSTKGRVVAIRALGHLQETASEHSWIAPLLVRLAREGRTHAEREAAVTSLARLKLEGTQQAVVETLRELPLDVKPERERVFVEAAADIAPEEIVPVLTARLEESIAAGQPLAVEVHRLGELQARESVPILLRAARFAELERRDRQVFARAFEQLKDSRAVPVLLEWLSDDTNPYRDAALSALMAIDDEAAVAAVRLRLKQDPDLRIKLRMSAMLGRHGIRDGYPVAIEHLAEPNYLDLAASALAAIESPETSRELLPVLENSQDPAWSAAALTGLLAVREPGAVERLFDILRDERHPLLLTATRRAGELGDSSALPLLVPLIGSRNNQLAATALRSVNELLETRSGDVEAEIRGRVADAAISLLRDPYADQELRVTSIETLGLTEDPRLAVALEGLADQPELYRSSLLARVERELREREIGVY